MEKTVLITGASTGIGRACALYLAKKGFRIFAGVRKPADGVKLQQAEPAVTPVILDITSGSDISSVRETIGDAPLHGLFNNAGINIAGPLEFLPIDQLRRQLEVNVIGHIAVTQAFLPNIRAARGRIVFTGSVAGMIAAPIIGPYAASKHALEALTDSLRVELAPSGIHVSLLEPGNIKTPIWEKLSDLNQSVFDNLPERARPLYGSMVDTVNRYIVNLGQRGDPPVKVAEVVHHALTAKHPKTRYRPGKHASALKLVSQFVPDKVRDFFISQEIKRRKR